MSREFDPNDKPSEVLGTLRRHSHLEKIMKTAQFFSAECAKFAAALISERADVRVFMNEFSTIVVGSTYDESREFTLYLPMEVKGLQSHAWDWKRGKWGDAAYKKAASHNASLLESAILLNGGCELSMEVLTSASAWDADVEEAGEVLPRPRKGKYSLAKASDLRRLKAATCMV